MRAQSYPVRTRRALALTTTLMADSPVLLLEGPRAVGKSTLLDQVTTAQGGHLIDLDEPATRDAVVADPALAVSGGGPVCLDEYQKAPEVLEAIKAELNKHTAPGRFVLTGSTRHDSLPSAAQSLTGRMTSLTVFPLSQGEQSGVHENFLEVAMEDPSSVITGNLATATRLDYIARICRGGFPLALAASSETARRRWIRDYIRLTLERDVRDLSNLRQGDKLRALLDRLAGQTAQVLNVTKVADDVGLTRQTAESFISLLEKVFLVHRLEAWGTTLIARTLSKPKVHVLDTAVAAVLMRLTPEKLATLDATASKEFGHLVETFAVGELSKQASWIEGITGIGHWRHHDGDEVDLIIEREDGGILGFEMKAGGRVPGPELKGLINLRDRLGDRFLGGIALYLGKHSYTYADRIHVAPLDRLWTPVS